MAVATVLAGMLTLALAAPTPGPSPTASPSVEELETRLASARGRQRLAALGSLADALSHQAPARELAIAGELLTLGRQLGDSRSEALGLYHTGKAQMMMGHAQEAIAPLTEARRLSDTLGDRKGVGDATGALGIAEYRRGRFDAAIVEFESALAIWRALGNKRSEARTLASLGSALCQIGRGREGAEHFERSLVLQREVGDLEGQALALNNIGIVRQHAADYAGAIEAYVEALSIDERIGNKAGISRASCNIAVIYKNLKQFDKAREYAERAMAIHRELGDRHSLAIDLDNLGAIEADEKRYEKAISYYKEALAIAEAMGNPASATSPLINLALAQEEMGRPAEAERYYERALELARVRGTSGTKVAPLLGLARLKTKRGDARAAIPLLEEAVVAAKAWEDREMIRDAHEGLAEGAAAAGLWRKAYEEYRLFEQEKSAIVHEVATRRVAEVEARFSSEKQAKAIELLTRDNEIQKLRLRNARWRTWTLVGGLGAAVALLAILLRRYRHLLAFWRSRNHVGAYRLLEEVGSGGMGVVYKAVHVRDRTRPVAIKLLRPELSEDPVLRQRLRNEGSLIDQLNHPNIVRVHERGESDHRLYVVMEWLDGETMAQGLRKGERLGLRDCLGVMTQLADAIVTLHSKGIIHRDLKPENVMLLRREDGPPGVKLLDFDIAKVGSFTRLTETGVIVGTVGYLAPERITTQTAAPASDVFALGVLFYELLTLERPFFGETAAEIVRHILDGEPLPPERLRGDVPEPVSSLVIAMLDKDPAGRPSGSALLERLRSLGEEAA